MITDEMVEKALNATSPHSHISYGDMRAALEAVAPMIFAAGLREAVERRLRELTAWEPRTGA